jgi:hypothetical protein
LKRCDASIHLSLVKHVPEFVRCQPQGRSAEQMGGNNGRNNARNEHCAFFVCSASVPSSYGQRRVCSILNGASAYEEFDCRSLRILRVG